MSELPINLIVCGDALTTLQEWPGDSVDCVITSPPYYGLRTYKVENQLGLEPTLTEYLDKLVEIFREVQRVLKPQGTFWLNIANSYCTAPAGNKEFVTGIMSHCSHEKLESFAQHKRNGGANNVGKVEGYKSKDLLPVAWLLALALQRNGWWLRSDIIWSKPNPLPESIKDRCTKAHEYIFLLTKSEHYYFDGEAIKEPSVDPESYTGRRFRGRHAIYDAGVIPGYKGNTLSRGTNNALGKKYPLRNKRDVWTVTVNKPRACRGHFAVYPEKLIEPCVRAGSPPDGIVLDPFMGSGTTGVVAKRLGRCWIGVELNPQFCELATRRIAQIEQGLFQ